MEQVDYDALVDKKFNNIINKIKSNNKDANIDLITRAFETAKEAHSKAKRESGEPYIIHPLGVVEILSDLELDDASICAGFLHDVVEDVEGWTIDRIREEFSPEIANLVEGLTKLNQQDFETDRIDGSVDPSFDIEKKKSYFTKNAFNMRRIFLAMSKDFRIMVIKLADRLHNMRTLSSLPPDRQKRMARETIQIFAPIAHRLGVYTIKSQLEDLSFKYLYPEDYRKMAEKVNKTKEKRKMMLEMCVDQLKNVLKANNIKAEVQARAKNFWSIRNKMIKKKCAFEDINDLLALRVIVKTQPECYIALGIVHELWIPIPGMFTDYIAKPKSNGYKSLHTKVLALDGEPIEVQIRTEEMHSTAENGVAAHWKYKEGTVKGDFFERKMSYLRQRLFNWQRDADNSDEFFNNLVNDMFSDQVFIFTPTGDVIDMKSGATPVDFAYRIHTNVGEHCVGAKINGMMMPLNTQLQNGDIVEIISRKNAEPGNDWLDFVKTDTAKTNIKRFFKRKYFDEYEKRGREFVEKEIKRQDKERNAILTQKHINAFLGKNYKTEKDLFVAIGLGNFSAQSFVNKCQKLIDDEDSKNTEEKVILAPPSQGKLEVSFDGITDVLYQRGRCCDPLPGEEVIGYVTRGRGITIHAKDCANVADLLLKEPERLVEIDWFSSIETFPARLKIKTMGKVGIINAITSIIALENVKLSSLNMKQDGPEALDMDLILNVKDYAQLDLIMTKIKDIPEVFDIYRPASRVDHSHK